MLILDGSGAPQEIIERAVDIAKGRFAREHASYRAEVERRDGAFTVSFIDAGAPLPAERRTRGNPGRLPGFVVVLDGATLAILESYFVR